METNNINNIIDIVYLTPENAEFTLSENKFLQLKANVRNPEKNQIDITKDTKDDNEINEIEPEEFFFERVFLHRAFPFQNPYEYISVSGNFPKTKEQIEEEEKKRKEEEEKKKKEAEESDSPALPVAVETGEAKKTEPKENTTSFGDVKEIGIIASISVFDEAQQKYINDELNRKYFIPIIESISSVKEKYGFSYWETKTNIGKIKFTVHDAFRNILKINEDRIMVTDVNGNRYEIVSLNAMDRQSFRKIELFL
jgi:hypothetical protein